MKVYEVRGDDYCEEEVRERSVKTRLHICQFALLEANTPYFTFTTRDNLQGICYEDFTGNLTVITE